MATTDDLHNELMHKHLAWFEKNIASPKLERDYTLPQENPLFQDSKGEYCDFKYKVWKYWTTKLLSKKRRLESVSLEEVWEEHGIITIEEYNKNENENTLTYPFKSE